MKKILLFVLLICFNTYDVFSMDQVEEKLTFEQKFDEACRFNTGMKERSSLFGFVKTDNPNIFKNLKNKFKEIDSDIFSMSKDQAFIESLTSDLRLFCLLLTEGMSSFKKFYYPADLKVIVDNFCESLGVIYFVFDYVIKIGMLPADHKIHEMRNLDIRDLLER